MSEKYSEPRVAITESHKSSVQPKIILHAKKQEKVTHIQGGKKPVCLYVSVLLIFFKLQFF